jgi:hypothetical protein
LLDGRVIATHALLVIDRLIKIFIYKELYIKKMITKQDFLSFLIDLQQSVKDETISEKDQQDLTLLYIKHPY